MNIKTCACCCQSRPITHFKIRATRAQMKAWGKEGNVRMLYESSRCKDCRKPPRKIAQLTTADIRARILNNSLPNNLSRAQAEDILRRRLANKPKQAADTLTQYHHAQAKVSWDPLIELARAACVRWKYVIKATVSKTLEKPSREMLTYLRTAQSLVEDKIKHMVHQYRQDSPKYKPADILRWEDLLDTYERMQILNLYEEIPYEQRAHLKQQHTLLINTFVTGKEQFQTQSLKPYRPSPTAKRTQSPQELAARKAASRWTKRAKLATKDQQVYLSHIAGLARDCASHIKRGALCGEWTELLGEAHRNGAASVFKRIPPEEQLQLLEKDKLSFNTPAHAATTSTMTEADRAILVIPRRA